MVSRQLPLLALVLALVSPLGSAQDTPYATSKLLQIPLKRHAMSHHPSHRAVRMLHQQERIRRRLAEGDDGDADGDGDADETEDDDESTDELLPPVNVTVGPVVFNEVPLGVGYGTHYAELYLGIPTQKASVIVDTGSHLTALPCSSCKGCGTHTDPSFDMSKSTTAKYVTCKQYTECSSCDKDKCYISQSYTEGSMWSAVVVDDLVWLGGMNDKHPERFLKHYGVRFPVGCQEKETGLFIKQKENGIMGFGRDKATLMSYMVKEKRVEHNVFAMCFSPSGGGLVLGGVDYSHHRTKVSYTPLVVDYSNWYPVKVKDILVGDKTLGVTADKLNSGKGVIVDSGTTDTFFASAASRAFKSVYSKMAGVDYSEDEMSISAEKVALLPNITIVLEGTAGEPDIALEVPATKYLTKADDGTYYGNFHFSERSGGVLGASTMVGYDVIFDMDQKRIGFAESNCDMHSPKSKTFAPPSEPKKITEPTIEETNTTSPTSGSKASTSSAPPASGDQSPAAGTAISNEATGSKSSAKSSGSFFGQILAVSVVGIVAVVAFKRVRKSSWVPLNESETGRNSLNRDDSLEDGEAPGDVTSPPRRKAASPMSPGSPPGSPPAPRFTIGSDSESETSGSPRNVTEFDIRRDDAMHAREEDRAATRAFLAAAQAGDIAAVDAYIHAGGDVNATLGERWKALHYAVARGHVAIVDRLLREHSTDLNALTIVPSSRLINLCAAYVDWVDDDQSSVGSSALALAMQLHNNVIMRMLLDGGASRATVSQDQLREGWDSSWIWPEVRLRLDPTWSILWSPATYHRFSSQEQQKYHLVLLMNHWSGQRGWATSEAAPNLSSGKRVRLSVQQTATPDREQNDVAPSKLSWILRGAWQRILGDRIEDEEDGKLRGSSTSTPQPASTCTGTGRLKPHWQYLPPVVLRLVLEYALFLW